MAQLRKENIEQIMSHILDIRYTEVEKEQGLSLELLQYAKEAEDVYVKAFAYTYLGDSCIAVNQVAIEKHGVCNKHVEGETNETNWIYRSWYYGEIHGT